MAEGIDNFLDEVLAMSGMTNSKQAGPSQGGQPANVPIPTPRPSNSDASVELPEEGPMPTERPNPDELSPEAAQGAIDNIEQQGEAQGATIGEKAAAMIAVVGAAAAGAYMLKTYGQVDGSLAMEEGQQLLLEDQRSPEAKAGGAMDSQTVEPSVVIDEPDATNVDVLDDMMREQSGDYQADRVPMQAERVPMKGERVTNPAPQLKQPVPAQSNVRAQTPDVRAVTPNVRAPKVMVR